MLALKAQRLPEEKFWPVLDSQWKDRVSRRTDDLFGHMSFQFFVPFPSIPQSKILEKFEYRTNCSMKKSLRLLFAVYVLAREALAGLTMFASIHKLFHPPLGRKPCALEENHTRET